MSIITTDLVTAFGARYINEGQNMESLKEQIRQPSVTPSYAVPIIHDSDVYRSSNSKLGEIVQGFQKSFTAKGDLTFTPNEIVLRNAKIDLALYPDDVKGKWLGFLANMDKASRADWEIVRYLLEKHVVPQIPHDMETSAYWGGSYVAPTPGTAGTTAGTLDGLKKLIDAGLVAGTMNAIALTNLPTASGMVECVEEFTDDIFAHNSALRGVKMRVFMEPKNLTNYFRDRRASFGGNVDYTAGVTTVDFSPNIELVALPSMEGSGYIWATPVDNFVHLRKSNGMKDPKVEEHLREVYLMLDWYEGIGFDYNQLVYAYKPA
jgi:hypothetical protein